MRINKFFTDNGICSRRAADKLIEAGRVWINGIPAKLGDQITAADTIAVDGQNIELTTKRPVVLAYHKPVGVECTSDPRVANNIIAAVNYPERVFHVGRLDMMSEGLILLTNLGDIVNEILRSRNEHEKEYLVEFKAPVTEAALHRLRAGVDIGDDRGLTKPCRILRVHPAGLRIVLTEGRNRQIRRMAEAIDNRVTRLKRIRVMNVLLGDLKCGTWRHLTPEEISSLLASIEG